MNLIEKRIKVQVFCLILLVGTSGFMPVFLNAPIDEQAMETPGEELAGNENHIEQRGTRGVENYDWPMFHHDVYMTGAQDPGVTVPGNNVAYTFDSGGDIEAIPAVVGDWVFFGNWFGPGEDYTFYGLNETNGWFWKYNTANNWPWRSSPAVAEIPGYGLMVFTGQSFSTTSNPTFYGFDADPDDNNDGVVNNLDDDEGVIDTPGAGYDIIWNTTLSYGFGRHSPLVADIPALGGNVLYLGTNDGTVYCLDASDGSIIWTWIDPTGDGFQYSHPTLGYDVLGNPVVFIINDDTSVQNTIYALNAVGAGGTTTVRWQSAFHGNAVRGGPALEVGSPGADDDRVYFITYQNPVILYCYDATPDDNGDNIIGGIGDNDEGLPDLIGSTYDLIWSYQLGVANNYAASTPALHNGKVFVGIADIDLINNRLYSLAQNTSVDHTHVVWSYDAPGDMYWSCPAVADNKVVITTRGYWGTSAGVAVVNESNGQEIWTNTSAFTDNVETSCAVANGKIYVGGDDNLLHVFGGGGGINNPPEIPELYSPADTSLVTSSNVVLDWSDSIDPNGDSVGYKIEINDTNDFVIPAYTFSGVGPSHLEVALPDGTWYWRVRAVDEFGAQSDWSVVWSFTVDTFNDPPSVTVLSPNGGEIWNGVHLISWSAYEPEYENMTFNVWLSDNSGASYDYLLASGVGTHARNWDLDTTLWPEGTTYRIKVEVQDARGLLSFDTSDDDFTIDFSHPIYDDWPQFMHYSNKTSQAIIDAPETNSIAWLSIPGDPPRSIQVSPAIFNGKVFFGDHYNRFICINETDGSPEWAYRYSATNNWADGAPAVGWIPFLNTYAVFMASDADGYTFIAFDIDGLSDGDQGIPEGTISIVLADSFNADVLWAFESGGNVYTSHPLVEGNAVYMWLFNLSSGNSQLYAFDINGRFNGDDVTRGIADSDIGMADRIWEWECPVMFNTPPTYGDGRIYIGSYTDSPNDNIFAFDADPSDGIDEGAFDPPGASYDMLWSNSVDEGFWGAPNFDNGRLYIATDDGSGALNNIHCLNASDGSVIWETHEPNNGRIQAAPAYWNDRMYVVTWGGGSWVYCYDATPEDGIDEGYDDPPAVQYDLIWQYDIPGAPRGQPAISDGKVYVATRDSFNWGALYCLDAIGDGTGSTKVIWNYYDYDDDFYAGPAIANGYVFQTAFGGKVYKFGVPINPDLAIFDEDIIFDPPTPGNNNTWVDITIRVSNLSPVSATTPLMRLIIDENDNGQYDLGETIIYNATISSVPGYKEVLVTVPWFASPVGYYNFIAEIDPIDIIIEPDETNNLAWNFYAVDEFATVDYIIINDTAGQGGNWVGDNEYSISETDTFFAHGFNNTNGYIGNMEVTWNSNDTGVGTVDNGPSSSTTFTAISPGYCKVTASYVLNPSITNETGSLHVLDWVIDYILIVDSQGTGSNEIPDQTVTIGSTIQGWAASFNNTGGYLGDVSVSWSVANSGSSAFTNPLSGNSSTFDADVNPGTATWIADDGADHNDTVVFTITDYTVDSIMIVDSPGTGAAEIPDQTVDIGFTIDGWAAAFNDSIGYIGDISVSWSVNNIGTSASTNPASGINSTFDAGSDGGTAQWIADDETGHLDYVNFTINPPSLDSIIIVDSPGTGTTEIPDQSIPVGYTIQGWAAGFNDTYGYIGEINVVWSVINTGGATATTNPGFGNQSEFDSGFTFGTATWIADDGVGHSDTVIFTIPPGYDYILIVDTPGTGFTEISNQTVSLGFTIEGWAAAYNNTVGYIGDVPVNWSVINSGGATASTFPLAGESSTFDADVNPGTATWIADDGAGNQDTVVFTIVTYTVDDILIVDTPNSGSNEIPDQFIDVGVSIQGWAAAFNDTGGYLGDISVSWSVSNIGSTSSTNPLSGTSSTFYSGENAGTATWTADDGAGHNDTVIFTINPPTRDSIMIVDSQGTGSNEILDLTVSVNFTITGWAAAFNNTIGYIGGVTVNWGVITIGTLASTNPPVGNSSTFNAGSIPGTATWTANDGSGNSDTVEFTIIPPTTDYILIVDTEAAGQDEIPDQTVNVGFSITGWAAAFNDSAGYIGDVLVNWSVNNVGTNASTNPFYDSNSDFNSGWFGGGATWTADDGEGHSDTVVFTVNSPTVDYIMIVDSAGSGSSEIPDQTVDIGSELQGFAASFNLTTGYLGDITVTWTVNNMDSNASTSPAFDTNSIFYSGWQEGTATWTADDGFSHNDTVVYSVNPPTVDFLVIVNSADVGMDEILDQSIGVGFIIEGWAAGFSNIAGYIGDVSVTWSVINIGSSAQTNPSSGISSTFNSGNAGGSVTWRADDGNGHIDTVLFTIETPDVDYIQIRDAPDGEGNLVESPVYPVGQTTRFYGALMNASAGFIDNAPTNTIWASDGETIVTATSPGDYTDIVCSDYNFGTIILSVDDGNGHINSTSITVLEPTTDYLQIMDEPGGAGSEISNPEYPVGGTDNFYGIMFNDTAGYIGNVPDTATWTSSNPRISVISPGPYTTITCSDSNYGTATITLDDGNGYSEDVLVEIMEPTADSVELRDSLGSGASPLANHNLNIGFSETYYAVAFNETAGNIGSVEVDWSSTNSEVGVLSNAFGTQTTFTAFSDKVGFSTISARYGLENVGSFMVTVVDGVSPEADAGSDLSAQVGETVFFDGSDSSDNVEIVSYIWTFTHQGSEVTLEGETQEFEFLKSGTYEITLEVIDSSGNSDFDTISVVVERTDDPEDNNLWVWLLLLIIVIIFVLILAMLIITKKKKKVQRCRICGNEFYPQTEAEASQGMCPNCATKDIFGQAETSASGEISESEAATKTVKMKCPECQKEFDFGVKGTGLATVTCPHCGTQGQMEI